MFVHPGRSLDPTIERLTQGLDKGRKVAARESPILVPTSALPQAVQGSFYHFHSQRLFHI
jgi:hypothetical protein